MPHMNAPPPLIPEQLHRYIEKHILPALGVQGDFSLEPVKSGSRNAIWFLTPQSGGSFVLKGISKRFRIKNIIWAHRYLEGRGLPVPKLVYADRAWKTAEETGYYFACEERIEGISLDELGENRISHMVPVAELFARMHQCCSFRWGKLKTFQFFGFRQYLIGRAAERLHALAESGAIDAKQSGLLGWFEQKSRILQPLSRFSLCHGDVNMKNILIGADNTISLIDTETFKYFPFQLEYFRLAYGLCGFDDSLHEKFKDCYAARSSQENLNRLGSCGVLYHWFVLLEIAWHFNKQLKRQDLTEAERHGFSDIRGKALKRLADLPNT